MPSIVDLLEKEIPPTRSWLEPRILPYSGIMICAASPKAGKSFVAMEMARAIATGEVPFGYEYFSVPNRGRVLLLDYEVTELGLQERASKVLEDEDTDLLRKNFMYISKDTKEYDLPSMVFSEQKGFDLIREAIDQYQPNVLIVDPIRKALGAWDESKAVDVGQLFNRLDKLVREFKHNKMSIIINHHYRKQPAGQYRDDWDPLEPDNASGSGRFFGDVDSLVTMYRDPERKWNVKGHEWWTIKTRWETRHAERPPDMFFHINEKDNLRVYFAGKVADGEPKVVKPARKPLTLLKGEQPPLMFAQPS